MNKSLKSACASGEREGGGAEEGNFAKAGRKQSATGMSEPESLRPEMEPSSAQYTNGAVLLCGTRFFVHGNRRSDGPGSREVPCCSPSRYFGS